MNTKPSPLASMTGYASVTGSHDGLRWVLEARSVNGRGLDVKLRLPSGLDALDGIIKAAFREHLVRGNVAVTVQIDQDANTDGLTLNKPMVEQLTDLAKQAEDITGQAVNLGNVLTIRGVLEEAGSGEISDAQIAAAVPAVTADVQALAKGLHDARLREGAAMLAVLEEHADSLDKLTAEADELAKTIPEDLRARLTASIAELQQDSDVEFPEERLAQEVLVLATKADIREELDRLKAHIVNLRELLAEGRGIGRRLDFLAQEFNREANTLCSKSSSTALTRIGMALKTVIDQLREQVQNIE